MGKSSSAESARQRGEAPSVELRAQPLSLPPSRLNVEVRSLLARGGRGARSATTASAARNRNIRPHGRRTAAARLPGPVRRPGGPPGSRCARGSRPGTWLTRSHPAQRSTQLAEAQLQRRGTRKSGRPTWPEEICFVLGMKCEVSLPLSARSGFGRAPGPP